MNDINYNDSLSHKNLSNIKNKNLGNLRYNKINLNHIKKRLNTKNKASSLQHIKGYLSKDQKNDSGEKYINKKKIKRINSNAFKYKFSENKKLESIGNNLESNTITKYSNLIKTKVNLAQNEKIERQKINEFKNLLDKIVSNFES